MAIENLKQIAIKYATTKGSRVPLAPDELCNAVVQYMNSFFGVMTDINTIKVAVTEDSGNIVFAITGNTYDGKPITPIVITVDHNDFVTDQEFEEFKTTTNAAIQKNTESINSLSFRVEDTENDITTIQVQVGQINTRVGNTETDVTNLKNRVDNTETNIAEINSTLNNKLDKISRVSNSNQVYGKSAAGENLMYNLESHPNAGHVLQYDNNGNIYVNKGSSEYTPANMQNIADVEAKIPDVSGFATKSEVSEKLDKTDQEFEEFKTTTNAAIQKNTESINSLSFRVEDTENDITTIQVQVGQINTRVGNTETDVTNLKNRVDNTETNIAEINSTLNNKLDKISRVSNSNQVYGKSAAGENLMYNLESHPNAGHVLQYDNNGNIYVNKGSSEYTPANMQNIADVEAKIPDVSGFATKSEVSEKLDKTGGTINGNLTVGGDINTSVYKSRGAEVIDLDVSNTRFNVGNTRYGINILSSNRPTVTIGESISNIALENDIPEYTSVDSVIYDATNGVIIAYNGANEIHIPLLAGENVTIAASEDNKKIVISAAGGGGAGDVTAAGNNIFTGENEFRNYTYDTSYFCFVDTKEDYLTNGYTTTIKNGSFDISYYENGEGKYWTTYADNQIINKDIDMEGEVVIKFPKKGGTFALTSDIIKNPIYFISFYANEPSEPCHLIGTMMSKNSYGTGQKTNEEFAVMLADNLYVNSNEGLAAYGRLAEKDILCIYSEDGLAIRCLNEENSEVDLPTVMFFVMETEL